MSSEMTSKLQFFEKLQQFNFLNMALQNISNLNKAHSINTSSYPIPLHIQYLFISNTSSYPIPLYMDTIVHIQEL